MSTEQETPSTEQEPPPIDLEETLRYLAVADEFRRQERAVEAHLEETDRRKIREYLLASYRKSGLEEDPALIDAAIDTVLEQRFRFREPEGTFLQLTLAGCYVRRAEIGLKVGLPVLALTLVGLGIAFAVARARENRLLEQERAVERSVESLHATERTHSQALARIDEDPLGEALPGAEKATLEGHLQKVRGQLEVARRFLATYAPAGDAGDSVTRENYSRVADEVPRIRESLVGADTSLRATRALLEQERQLQTIGAALEALIAEIRRAGPPASLAQRAESVYADALGSLRQRQVGKGEERHRELEKIRKEISDLSILSTDAGRLRESIRGIAREEGALALADSLFSEASRSAASASVEQLRNAVERLRGLEATLGQEYTITIVGGVWRYKEDNPAVKNYYLRVKALDSNRRPLRMRIRNEETGREETVAEWAERVPRAVYDGVGQDKTDNGIIDDSLFGKKERGMLTVERKFEDLGQITRW